MPLVKVDEKGRIQLPKRLRHEMNLKARQSLIVQRQGEHLTISRIGKTNANEDPLLNDILLRPIRTKTKITKELLDKLEKEQWAG